MSFLDRFQNKIATVTAHGHLKKADGSEEIRVGPPKRKPKASAAGKQAAQSYTTGSGASAAVASSASRTGKQSSAAAVPPLTSSQSKPTHDSQSNSNAKQQSYASPRSNNTGRDAPHSMDNNQHHRYDTSSIPGSLIDDDAYNDAYDEPQHTHQSSYTSSSNKSPTQRPTDNDSDRRSRQQAPEPASRSPRPVAHAPLPSKTAALHEPKLPQEINEARVQNESDQLAFSRKARPVTFAPCKLAQYKKEKPAEYYELGKLQPDLNSDDLVQKRANAERIKAFSKNLRAINNRTTTSTITKTTGESPREPGGATSTSTRSKALAFAKRIPKPKATTRATADDASSNGASNAQIAGASRPINCVLDDDSEDDDVSSELQQLQLRHQASRAQVDALIKKG